MDETSYSDPGVIDAINERFVPVRVDNDRRPDVNARYNMGGWPTTAFLAPDGTTLTGATYLPPQQMRRALDEIARFYAEHKDEIAERRRRCKRATRAHLRTPQRDLRDAPIVALLEQLEQAYDDEFGGFGDAPKFPQPEVLEFLARRVASRPANSAPLRNGRAHDARDGARRHVRSRRRRLLPVLDDARLVRAAFRKDGRRSRRTAARARGAGAVRADQRVSRDARFGARLRARGAARSGNGFFAGSQDADEAYFALPLEERRKREAPYVDRTSYTNWTCALAGA